MRHCIWALIALSGCVSITKRPDSPNVTLDVKGLDRCIATLDVTVHQPPAADETKTIGLDGGGNGSTAFTHPFTWGNSITVTATIGSVRPTPECAEYQRVAISFAGTLKRISDTE